eukprot:ANDGO_07567.mRNA.1 hypothetical protein
MSLKSELHASLEKLEANALTLFAAISQYEGASAKVPEKLVRVFEENDRLQELLSKLKQHQERQSHLEKLQKESQQLEKQTRKTIHTLLEAQTELLNAQDLCSAVLRRQPQKIPVDTLVEYARQIRFTSMAPSWWQPGLELGLYKPPAPRKNVEVQQSCLWPHLQDAGQTLSGTALGHPEKVEHEEIHVSDEMFAASRRSRKRDRQEEFEDEFI